MMAGAMLAYQQRLKLIQAYSDLFGRYVDEGWAPFLLTLMFKALSGGSRLPQMNDEVERIYSTLLTRVVRRPLSTFYRNQIPILISTPDLAVRKCKRQKLSDFSLNGGLHVHGILLMPPRTRLKGDLVSHFSENKHLYQSNRLLRLDIRAIDSNLPYVTDYVFKSVKHRKFDFDDVLILPRPTGTLRERTICL